MTYLFQAQNVNINTLDRRADLQLDISSKVADPEQKFKIIKEADTFLPVVMTGDVT